MLFVYITTQLHSHVFYLLDSVLRTNWVSEALDNQAHGKDPSRLNRSVPAI